MPPTPLASSSACQSQLLYRDAGSSPPPLQSKFYISLNFQPSLQNCQLTSPTPKGTKAGWPKSSTQKSMLVPRCRKSPPATPRPPRRPPAWSCGQFNQPSFPKLSQPAQPIVTAGKNRQLLSGAALWGAPIHLFKQISKRAAALSSPLSSPGLTMG